MNPRIEETDEEVRLLLDDNAVAASEVVRPGVRLDYDDAGQVIAVSVQRTSSERESEAPDGWGIESFKPRTPLGEAFLAVRRQLRDEGVKPLTWEELDRELAERRGLPPEQRLEE